MRDLSEITPVRFFSDDKKRRAKYLRSFPGRFENDSHFIRSAVQFFERHLDQEIISKKIEKKVRR